MTLTESVTYDDRGYPMENSLFQYKIPARVDIGKIRVEFENSYEGEGPFGAKSIGEVVINTPLPAISDAIRNAITKYYISSGTVSHLWTVPLLFLCGDCLLAAALEFLHSGFHLGFGRNIYHPNGSKVNVHLHSAASVYLLLLSVFKL